MKRLKTFFFLACGLLFLAVPLSAVDAKIVYTDNGDIFVMNDDGSRRHRLTQNTTAFDSYPRWSPDGTQIAFTRDMDKTQRHTAEIFVMNVDRNPNPQRLTHNNVIDADPAWSPDGTQIAFSSTLRGPVEVFILDVDTQTVTQLTVGGRAAESAAPDWSPDGTQITIERFLPVPNGIAPKTIYIMDADGQHQRPLLPHPPLEGPLTLRYFPRWSTDGHRILFSESRWFPEGDINRLIIQRLGRGKQALTAINDRLGEPFLFAGASWMEDNQSVVFSLKRLQKPAPNYDLYRYTLSTRGLRKLRSEPGDEKWPDWIAGELSVYPTGKKTTVWGSTKKESF